jgi:hypothetical protein
VWEYLFVAKPMTIDMILKAVEDQLTRSYLIRQSIEMMKDV